MNYIFFRGNILERNGGPSTYLYNLKEGLANIGSKEIRFLYNEKVKTNKKKIRIDKYKKLIANHMPKMYERIMLKHIFNIGEIYKQLNKLEDIEIMHFHLTSDFVKADKFIPNDTIKILTMHCPEMPSIETRKNLESIINNKNYNLEKIEKEYFERFDKIALQKANVLIFPSKEAMEPYYETCSEFEKLIDKKDIKYIMTGTKPLKYKKDRKNFRIENKIPENAFVISFVGRHNEVKGYDNFIKIAKNVMNKKDDIYIITAGIGNIESPKNARWIDFGWTDDPGSVINASDLFILPNRRTYFDLILLETLSIGKTCLVSNNGGNKTIERLTEGVIKYDNIEEATNKIMNLYDNIEKLQLLGEKNKEAYERYFTIDKFAENYINVIEEIRKERNI